MTKSIAFVCAFVAYLVASAVFAATHADHVAGIVTLAVIAAGIGWYSSVSGAALAGLAGWPFFAGFVTHTDGQIGVTGRIDLIAVLALVAAAVLASLLGGLAARLRPEVAEPVEQLGYAITVVPAGPADRAA